jgi:hypothetical protein
MRRTMSEPSMSESTPSSELLPDPNRLAATQRLAQALDGVLRVAEGLVRARRRVDLRGLDDTVGRLCAYCLDLPPEHGRTLRPQLQHVLRRAESLEAALVPPPPRPD